MLKRYGAKMLMDGKKQKKDQHQFDNSTSDDDPFNLLSLENQNVSVKKAFFKQYPSIYPGM